MNCDAVTARIAKRKGKASIEYFYEGRPHYYCFGYVDKRTDDLFDCCRNCKSNVIFAQDDYDKLNGKRRE